MADIKLSIQRLLEKYPGAYISGSGKRTIEKQIHYVKTRPSEYPKTLRRLFDEFQPDKSTATNGAISSRATGMRTVWLLWKEKFSNPMWPVPCTTPTGFIGAKHGRGTAPSKAVRRPRLTATMPARFISVKMPANFPCFPIPTTVVSAWRSTGFFPTANMKC